MVTLNSSQKELIEHRQEIYFRWQQRHTKAQQMALLYARVAFDDKAFRTIQRMIHDAKVVLYDGGRLLLSSVVWASIRNCMRISPGAFYERQTDAWATVYPRSGSPANTKWHATAISGDDAVPSSLELNVVPAEYSTVTDLDVLKRLGYAGGRIIELTEMPSGSRLFMENVTIEVRTGNIARDRLQGQLGAVPYVYSEVEDVNNLITIAENGIIDVVTGSTPVGTYEAIGRVTDSSGTAVIATINIVITAT